MSAPPIAESERATALSAAMFHGWLTANPLAAVEFRSAMCGSSATMTGMIERWAAQGDAMLAIGTIDVLNHRDIAESFAIMTLPTILLFVEGRKMRRVTSARPLSYLIQMLGQNGYNLKIKRK